MGSAKSWNFFANVCDGALFSMAMSLVSQQTVLPVFVRDIGGGSVALGLIPVVWTFGFNFPQVLIASRAEQLGRKKGLLLRTAMGQRIPWLLIAIFAFLVVGRVTTGVALLVFFVLFALAAMGGSLNLPVWFDLIAKLTPVQARGRLFAARSICGAVLGIFGGWVVALVLETYPFPTSFAILLCSAFAVMMVSYACLITLREETDSPIVPLKRVWRSVRSAPRLLRAGGNFRNYLVADALLISASMANAFFAVYALQKFNLPDSSAGTFTIAMMASMIAGSALLGPLADRFGHKVNILISSAATTVACVGAVLAPSAGIYLIVFGCSAVTTAVATISRLPLIAELCPEAERPTSVALANLITSPFVLTGIVAGWLAQKVGYEPVFIVAALLSFCALLWLAVNVREPRAVRVGAKGM